MLQALVYNKFGHGGDQVDSLNCLRPYRAVIDLMKANFLPQSRSFWLQCALEFFAKNPRKIHQAISFFDHWNTRNKSNKVASQTSATISNEAHQEFVHFHTASNLTRDDLVSVLWVACCHPNIFPEIHTIAAKRAGERLRVRGGHKLQMVVSTYREPAMAVARKGRR